MHTFEASSGSNTPAAGNGTRRRKELLGFKLQKGETRIPIWRHRLISWLMSAKKLLRWRSVTTKWCLTNVWQRGSWARKKSEDVSITTESEDVFSGGDWETGLAEDEDVKRKPLRHRFIELLISPRNFPQYLRTRAHNLWAELVDTDIHKLPSAPWPWAS